MFRTFPLSIIRSFSLYTQQWYMSYRFADSLRAGSGWNSVSQIYSWNETLHVSDSSSVHHQEFFTVHTAMVYVIEVCWQLANRIRILILLASCQNLIGFIMRNLSRCTVTWTSNSYVFFTRLSWAVAKVTVYGSIVLFRMVCECTDQILRQICIFTSIKSTS